MNGSIEATDSETRQEWNEYYKIICTLPLLTYCPLDQTKRSIRLISTDPEAEHPLRIHSEYCLPVEQCTIQKRAVSFSLRERPHPLPRFILEEVSLTNEPEYSALSYVWGSAESKRAILVNGRIHLVTKNLFSVLVNVKVPTSKIWIDAICIHQEDDDEKSWQVQQMREIYQQAHYTAAWLGPRSKDCGVILSRILEYASWPRCVELEAATNFESQVMSIAEQYYAFSILEYWGRVWIHQEQYASKNIHFHCGGASFPHHALRLFCGHMQRLCLCSHSPAGRSPTTSPALSVKIGMFAVAHLAIMRFLIRCTFELTMMDLLRRGSNGCMRATDPRDRIYAFLGMVLDTAELAIVIDYKKDWRDVFVDFSIALFRKEGPAVLALCNVTKFTVPDPELPSWVVDLNRGQALSWVMTFKDFSAAGGSKAAFEVSPGSGKFSDLSISGVLVDIIKTTGTKNYNPGAEPIPEQLSKLEELALQCGDMYGSTLGRSSAVWRIPVANHLIYSQRNDGSGKSNYVKAPSDEILGKIYAYIRAGGGILVDENNAIRGLADAAVDADMIAAYIEVFERITIGTNYFVSETGYLGLGFNAVEAGDHIVLIFGLHIPYILRPLSGGKYSVIGDAYVHGIMEGELVAQSHKTEVFTIC